MRASTLIVFAFSAVFATSPLNGQTDYPWRTKSGVQPVVIPDMQNQRQQPQWQLPSTQQGSAATTSAGTSLRESIRVASKQQAARFRNTGSNAAQRAKSQRLAKQALQDQAGTQPLFKAAADNTNSLRQSLQRGVQDKPQEGIRVADNRSFKQQVASLSPRENVQAAAVKAFNQAPVAPQVGPQTNSLRKSLQQAGQPIRVARNTAIAPQSGFTSAPVPPKMDRRPFLVSFRNKQDEAALADPQPSVSDINQYDFTPPKAPQTQPTDLSYPGASAEPALQIQSNAGPEETTTYCDRDCRKNWCNLGCEKKLFGKSCSGLEMGGWLSMGYHNRNNPLVNNRKAEANLHQAWLFAENAASRDTQSWDIGYRTDLLYGIDAQDLQAFGNAPSGAATGWDNGWDHGSYGWALPQMYVQFANATWDVKVGKFFSPFGYEVIGSRDNFFYSHSFTMYNSEPFTMSGILAERQVTENRSMIIGATAGWDTGFDNNGGGALITGTRYQPNQYVDLALTSSLGDAGTRGSGRLVSGVAQLQLTESLKYVLQADVLDLDDNQEFGIVQYMFRDVNECLALGARLEWWKSDQFFTDTKSTYSFTMGANYRTSANLTLRPEVRFDWGAAAVDPGTAIIGIDAVMTF